LDPRRGGGEERGARSEEGRRRGGEMRTGGLKSEGGRPGLGRCRGWPVGNAHALWRIKTGRRRPEREWEWWEWWEWW
jgi:hypothetical protein